MANSARRKLTRRQQHAIEVSALVLLALVSIVVKQRAAPLPSAVVPGLYRLADDNTHADPPSMDELWHLALSAGHGEHMELPINEVVHDVPAWTSIKNAPPWYTLWTSMAYVVHPPLYVQTLRFWRELFGDSDGVAITYSLLWSIAAVIAVYFVGRIGFDRGIAFWSAMVMAVAPSQTYYALEIRAYAMLTVIAAAMLYVVFAIKRDGPQWRWCIALGATLLIAMLTHYFALGLCLAAAGSALACSPRKQAWRVAAACAAAGVVYAAVWMPWAWEQRNVVAESSLHALGDRPFSSVVVMALMGPLRLIQDSLPLPTRLNWPVAAMVVVVPIIVAWRDRSLRILIAAAMVPILLVLAVDAVKRTHTTLYIRYTAAAAPAAILMLVASVSILARRLHRSIPHLVLAACCVALVINPPAPDRYDAPNFSPFDDALAPAIGRDTTIVIYAANVPSWIRWAMAIELTHIPGVFPRDLALIDRPLSPEQIARIRTRRVFLVEFTARQPTELIPGGQVERTVPFPVRDSMGRVLKFLAYDLTLDAQRH